MDWLNTEDQEKRGQFFDALLAQSQTSLVCLELGKEKYIANCQDHYISRALYIGGAEACEFYKFIDVIDILSTNHQFPKKVDCLIDVGANIGVISIPAVFRGYCERALAIEPQKRNCEILRANIALNGLHDFITVVEAAAGPYGVNSLELAISPENAGDHRIAVSNQPGQYHESEWGTTTVKSICLDSLEGQFSNSANLIWMDIQGYEGFALQGAKQLLDKHIPLVLEFWPYGMNRAKSFLPLLEAVQYYDGFYVVEKEAIFRPISDLTKLWEEVGVDGKFLDVLIV